MKVGVGEWRRALGRELTRLGRASIGEILACPTSPRIRARRIGITGAPGAGKSSLIAALANHRLLRGGSLGVLAIDPTSPISKGSLLGDRVRMDDIVENGRVYIRSMPSGERDDGLCHNVAGLLDAFEQAGFDDVILETVGVGQTSYDARRLVDCLILTLVPDSGDTIQAMKAGIMELPDIYVITKADLDGAKKLAREIRSVIRWRASQSGWGPPLILASVRDDCGIDQLDAAIESHLDQDTEAMREERFRGRLEYQVRSLLEHRIKELTGDAVVESGDLATAYKSVASRLQIIN